MSSVRLCHSFLSLSPKRTLPQLRSLHPRLPSIRTFSTTPNMSVDLLSPSPLPCFVGGVAKNFSGSYEVKDPHNPDNVVLTVSAVQTEAEVLEVIESAAEGFKVWRKVSRGMSQL